MAVFAYLKRKFVKVNDIAVNTESNLIGDVRGLAVIDGETWAIWKLHKKGQLVLIKASKLHAVRMSGIAD